MSKHLTIAELAEATGTSPATLRAWESRHGFPRPRRLPGGHRRYTPEDASAIQAVLAEREAGATLGAAIARARAAATEPVLSLFAAFQHAAPVLSPRVVSKRTMVALSHAIEDECSAQAERGLLVGSFQEERFYAAAATRWRDLASGARHAVVFADFRVAAADEQPARVPLARRSPLEREWAIVHLAPRSSVMFVGRELPGRPALDAERRFEMCWTAEPSLVFAAVEVAIRVAEQTAPAAASALRSGLDVQRPSHHVEPRFLTTLTTRMIGYLDR